MATIGSNGDGWDPIGGVQDLLNGVTGAVSYWSDPWGNTFKALQDAASGLSRDVLPALTAATLPDLSTDWFIRAYAVSFGASIFIAVALLIPQVIRTARGAQAGRDLIDSMGLYFGMFLAGAMFGPLIGMVLVNFFHALSDDIVRWGLSGSVDGVVADFQRMIAEADPVGITGGVPIAVFLMFCMILGLFLVFAMLVVQLVTLYFTGVLLPLGLVWIIDPTRRAFGLKIVSVWVGILAAHPLLFFLLGFAFMMMANSVNTFGNNLSLMSLVQFSVAVIALFIAALSPLLLLKFAPVIPSGFGGTNGPAVSTSAIGPQNMSDAVSRFDRNSTNTRSSYAGQPQTYGGASSSSAAEGGSTLTLADASAARAGASAAATSGSAAAATGTAGAVAEGAAASSTAAGGLAAAGAAESATGAGAAIGIPTLLLAAGAAAGSKAIRMTESAGQQATGAMDSTIGADRT
ncbi:MAG: hypothetical protein ACOH10_00150 [Rhodoglobus sp.]